MTSPHNNTNSYSDLTSDFQPLLRPKQTQSFSDIPTDLCNRSEYGDAETIPYSDQQQVGEKEPWDTPSEHTPQTPPREDTPQPDTCPHCNQPILTFHYLGLRIRITPHPLTPREQTQALLTNTTLFTLKPATPYRHAPTIATHINPTTRAHNLLGTPTNALDHPNHPTHARHTCPRRHP